jgi:hypothetical protein
MTTQRISETVEYRDIPGHTGYRVGSDGSIWSRWKRKGLGRGRGTTMVLGDTWSRLRTPPDDHGYLVVQLGRGKKFGVHKLVLLAFVGPCPSGQECCHSDNNKANPRLNNLRWDTSKSNTDDQRAAGTLVLGERHGMHKLTDAEIKEIRRLGGTIPQRELAEQFGITQPHVSEILAGKKRKGRYSNG